MFRLQYDIEGKREISRILGDIQRADLKRPFQKIGKYAKEYYGKEAWQSKGNAFGMPWAELSEAYKKNKAKKGLSTNILEATGDMKNSFAYRSGKVYAVITNKAPYMAYHQSNKPRKKLPRRVIMGINDQMRERFTKEIQLHMVKELQKR